MSQLQPLSPSLPTTASTTKSYIDELYEIANLISSLLPRFQEDQRVSTEGHKSRFLTLTEESISKNRQSGLTHSALSVAGVVAQLAAPILSPGISPIVQAFAPQISNVGSALTTHMQTGAARFEKLATLHQLSLQDTSTAKQSDESLKQGVTSLAQGLQSLLTQASRGTN
ncbi:MAG TPA: hypothetical protein VJK48_06830 [Chlamydiales bacterium]|nr:hypothetical protein [Chlamydiales bacterium]